MTVPALRRRYEERGEFLARARAFAAALPPGIDPVAVVVFGSVARGDWNRWSDIDVLVIAQHLPDRPLDRLAALGDRPASVAPIAWTPTEWQARLDRRDPIAVDAKQHGVWLRGRAPDCN